MKNKKWMIISILVIGMCAAIISNQVRQRQIETGYIGAAHGKVVEVCVLKKTEFCDQIEVLGTMVAINKKNLYTEANDRVKELPKRVGDKVKAGEIVATFEGEGAQDLTHQIEQLTLQIENSKLNLNETADVDVTAKILELEAQMSTLQKSAQELNESIRNQKETIKLSQEELDKLKKDEETNALLLQQGALAEVDFKASQTAVKNQEAKLLHEKAMNETLETQKDVLSKQKESVAFNLQELRNVKADATYQRDVAKSQNDVQVLESKKEVLEEELDKITTTLVAPIDGYIASIEVVEGQSVTPQTSILSMIGSGEMLVKVELDTDEVSYVEVGQKCQLSFSGKTQVEGEGVIKRVAPSVVTETKANGTIKKSIPAEIEIQSLSQSLRDGMELDVKIQTLEMQEAMVVPKRVVLSEKMGEYFVYTASQEGKVQKVPVQILNATKEEVAIDGVSEGTYIIMSELEALKEGQEVRFSIQAN